MLGKEMVPHLLIRNPPNLVEIKQKQNKLKFFIDNLLSHKNLMKMLLNFFFFCTWAKTPQNRVFVPIGGTTAIMHFLNRHLLKFMKIHDIKAESVAFLVK